MGQLEKSNSLVFLELIEQKDGDKHLVLRTNTTNPAYLYLGKYRNDGAKIEIKREDGTSSTAILPSVEEPKARDK